MRFYPCRAQEWIENAVMARRGKYRQVALFAGEQLHIGATMREEGAVEFDWNKVIGIGTCIIAAGTLIAAICAVLTARYARDAASTWESTLRNQNIDNCISALAEIRAALERCGSFK